MRAREAPVRNASGVGAWPNVGIFTAPVSEGMKNFALVVSEIDSDFGSKFRQRFALSNAVGRFAQTIVIDPENQVS